MKSIIVDKLTFNYKIINLDKLGFRYFIEVVKKCNNSFGSYDVIVGEITTKYKKDEECPNFIPEGYCYAAKLNVNEIKAIYDKMFEVINNEFNEKDYILYNIKWEELECEGY